MKKRRLKEKWDVFFAVTLMYLVLVLGVIILNARIEYLNQVIK